MRTNAVDAALVALESVVTRLAGANLDGLAHVELLAALRVQHRLVNRMEAQRTRLIATVRSRGAVVEEGAPSTAVWLRTALHVGDAVAQLRAATVTEVLPRVAEAYLRGDFGLDHVEVVASVARDFRPGALAHADERFAVEAARVTPEALRRAAASIRDGRS